MVCTLDDGRTNPGPEEIAVVIVCVCVCVCVCYLYAQVGRDIAIRVNAIGCLEKSNPLSAETPASCCGT